MYDALRSDFHSRSLHYWREKSQREVDVVVEQSRGEVDALEAEINPDALNPKSLNVFENTIPMDATFWCVRSSRVRTRFAAERRKSRSAEPLISASVWPGEGNTRDLRENGPVAMYAKTVAL